MEHKHTSNGPVLLLGDSFLRGIQQRKFMRNQYANKQTITGGTREMNQCIEHMQDRNDMISLLYTQEQTMYTNRTLTMSQETWKTVLRT